MLVVIGWLIPLLKTVSSTLHCLALSKRISSSQETGQLMYEKRWTPAKNWLDGIAGLAGLD